MSASTSPSQQLSRGAPRVGAYRRGPRLRTTPAGTWFPAVDPSDRPAGLLLVHPAVDLKALIPTIERLAALGLPGVHLPNPELVQQSGRNWLVTDAPPVPALADILDEGEHRGPGNAAVVLTDLATTLLAVHGAGLAHGRVNERSVLIDARGTGVLTDWGTSSSATEAADVRSWSELARLLAERWCPDDASAASVLSRAGEKARADGLAPAVDHLAGLALAARRPALAAIAQARLSALVGGGDPVRPAKPEGSRPSASTPGPAKAPRAAAPAPGSTRGDQSPKRPTATDRNGAAPAAPPQATKPPDGPYDATYVAPPTTPLRVPTAPQGSPAADEPKTDRPGKRPARATPNGTAPGRTDATRPRTPTWQPERPSGRPSAPPDRPSSRSSSPPSSPPERPSSRASSPPDRPSTQSSSRTSSRSGRSSSRSERPAARTEATRPRRWVFPALCALTAAAVLTAATTVYLLFVQKQSPAPVRIESVTLWKHQAGTTCTLIGVITTNGEEGAVAYGWTSEAGTGPVLTQPVGKGHEQVEVRFDWHAEPTQAPDPVVTLQVLQPELRQVTAHPATDCH